MSARSTPCSPRPATSSCPVTSSAASATARCSRPCGSCPRASSTPAPTGGRPVTHARRLTLAHLWVAFAAFAIAAVFGVWQMWGRSPLPTPFLTANAYFTSVTAHGAAMAYTLPTFMVMGFGYYVAETALGRPLPFPSLAWLGFALGVIGATMASVAVFRGCERVFFPFCPPLTASPFFYLGL